MKRDKCLRCGQCCWWYDSRAGYWRECRFLARDSKGFTTCMIYHKRIGTCLGDFTYCVNREDYHFNYPGCPYNKKEWPMHPAYQEVKQSKVN